MAITFFQEKQNSTLVSYDRMLEHYGKTAEVDLQKAYAYNALAWFLSTCREPEQRDGKKAIEYAEKALFLGESICSDIARAALYDTLAAAHAESGDFEKAALIESKAYNLVKPIPGEDKSRDTYEELIEAYSNKKTYVQWEAAKSER
jgi:hypothetical protein